MFGWFSKREQPQPVLDEVYASRGICIKCGQIIRFCFDECPRCSFTPMSETDLATALATSEQIQRHRFPDVAASIEAGATPQLSAEDLESNIIMVRKRGFRHMVGYDQKDAVRRDQLETRLDNLAPKAMLLFRVLLAGLERRLGVRGANLMIVAGLVGNAAVRGIVKTIDDEADRKYVLRAFPHRLAKLLSNIPPLRDAPEHSAKIALHFPEVMAAVAEIDAMAQGPDGDDFLAKVIFDRKEDVVALYVERCFALITTELASIEASFARSPRVPMSS